jgi:hypothetical protein
VIFPEVSVTDVPETDAVNDAMIGKGSAPELVVPPPVIASPLSHPTVG